MAKAVRNKLNMQQKMDIYEIFVHQFFQVKQVWVVSEKFQTSVSGVF